MGTGKIKNLIEPSDENEMEMMKTDVDSNGEDDGAARGPNRKKCENPTSNTDTTNDNTDMKDGKHGGRIKNLMEPSDEIENETTKTKVEYDGKEAGVTSKAQPKKYENPTSNTGNTGIGSSNSKCNAVDTKILEPPDKNENKKIGNNVEFNGDNSSEMPELQQQKCENAMPIAIINDMTHAGRNNDYDEVSGGTKTVTNTETNMETTNIEVNNGEEVEAEAEAEAEAETEVATNNSNNSNTAIITVQLLEDQVRKMKILETRIRAAENN